jgi:citrate synthase
MPHAERIELQDPSGSVMADLQAGLATLGPKWGLKQLVDIPPEAARDDLARLSAAALSIVAQAARGPGVPVVPESEVEKGKNAAAQFLIRWRGEADPRHVTAVDTYWVSAAEHGLNASTFTARIAASTGADCAASMSAAVGALSGPLHGGAPTRVLKMLDEVEQRGDAEAYVHDLLVWAAVVLEVAQIPPPMYPAMFGCARVAGWSAHILEQRRTGKLIRPSAKYVGPPAHSLATA